MEARQHQYQVDQKQRFDQRRTKDQPYAEGDLVLIGITSTPATGSSKKLLARWRGPFRITKVLGRDRFEISDIPGSSRTKLQYTGVAGIDNIRPWIRYDQE